MILSLRDLSDTVGFVTPEFVCDATYFVVVTVISPKPETLSFLEWSGVLVWSRCSSKLSSSKLPSCTCVNSLFQSYDRTYIAADFHHWEMCHTQFRFFFNKLKHHSRNSLQKFVPETTESFPSCRVSAVLFTKTWDLVISRKKRYTGAQGLCWNVSKQSSFSLVAIHYRICAWRFHRSYRTLSKTWRLGIFRNCLVRR